MNTNAGVKKPEWWRELAIIKSAWKYEMRSFLLESRRET
jgi:hypothetical protein